MQMLLSMFAAGYGAAAGLLVPRPAYRLAVTTAEPWRTACPAGHPLTGPARGWLGPARCAACPAGRPGPAGVDGEPAAAGTDGPPPARAAVAPTAQPAEPSAATATAGPADAAAQPAESSAAPTVKADTATGPTADASAGPSAEASDAPDASEAGPSTASPEGRYDRRGIRSGGWYGPRTIPVAIVTGVACGVIAAVTGPRPELAVWLLLAPLAVVLAVVDRAVHRLPDVLTLPLAAATAGLLGLAELLPGNAGSWPAALLGGAGLGAVYFLLFVINPSGMGFGDVKLALPLGLALGWYGLPVLIAGAFAGFLVGSLYGMGLMLLRRAGRKTAMPFGPFMIFGAFLGVLLGAPGPL